MLHDANNLDKPRNYLGLREFHIHNTQIQSLSTPRTDTWTKIIAFVIATDSTTVTIKTNSAHYSHTLNHVMSIGPVAVVISTVNHWD